MMLLMSLDAATAEKKEAVKRKCYFVVSYFEGKNLSCLQMSGDCCCNGICGIRVPRTVQCLWCLPLLSLLIITNEFRQTDS